MKYLKYFESIEGDHKRLSPIIKDIMLGIEDNGIRTYNYASEECICVSMNELNCTYSDISNILNHLISYMSGEGYYCSFLDGSDIQRDYDKDDLVYIEPYVKLTSSLTLFFEKK